MPDTEKLVLSYIRQLRRTKMEQVAKSTKDFELSVLTLTVPGLRFRKVQNTSCV
jgi:hypothetical protein